LQLARDIVLESESEQKWKQLGDAALNLEFDLKLAEECMFRAKDLGGLLMLYTSTADADVSLSTGLASTFCS
jgi:coatomer subunit beta'